MVFVLDQGVWSDFFGMAKVTFFQRLSKRLYFAILVHFPQRFMTVSNQRAKIYFLTVYQYHMDSGGVFTLWVCSDRSSRSQEQSEIHSTLYVFRGLKNWKQYPCLRELHGAQERQESVMSASLLVGQ